MTRPAVNPTELLGDPPAYFDDELRSIWSEIAGLMMDHEDMPWTKPFVAEMASRMIRDLRTAGISAELTETLLWGLRLLRMRPVEIAKLTARQRTRESDAWATLEGMDRRVVN